jgi:Predicted membrane protein
MLWDKRRGSHNTNYQRYVIYFFPLLLAVIFIPSVSGKSEVVLADSFFSGYKNNIDKKVNNQSKEEKENGQISNTSSGNDQTEPKDIEYSNVDDYLQATQDQQENPVTPKVQEQKEETEISSAYHKSKVDGYYIIDENSFADWFMDLYDHPDDFTGEKYQFLAQVFSMDDIKANQFLAGRNFMVCCAADLVGYGLICNYDDRKELKENQWIIVKATISKCSYQGSTVPMLVDALIQKTKAPKNEYIYYNNY